MLWPPKSKFQRPYKQLLNFEKLGAYRIGIKLWPLLTPSGWFYWVRIAKFLYRCFFKRRLLLWGAYWTIFKDCVRKRKHFFVAYMVVQVTWFFCVYRVIYMYGMTGLRVTPVFKDIVEFVSSFFGFR
jgi:hypothetical protein